MEPRNRKLLNIELGRLTPQQYRETPGSGIVLVLDNIRSAHNVGSAFRTADSFKADRIYLCGICATPPSAEIHKSVVDPSRHYLFPIPQTEIDVSHIEQNPNYSGE